MRLVSKLDVKQTQILAPITLLEAELLQLPLDKLEQRIREELEANPCLEEAPKWEKDERDHQKNELPRIEEFTGDPVLPLAFDHDEEEEEIDARWQAPQIGFWERVDVQVSVNFSHDPEKERIAQAIADSLDGRGLLSKPVEEIAKELGVSPELVEEIRRQMMLSFDPVGVAAKDQREVYLVQLEELGYVGSPLYKIISEKWELAKEKGIEKLLRENGLSEEEVREQLHILKGLYPFPVEKYSEERSNYIYPEVIIKIVDGRLVVELVESGLPRITLSSYYSKILQDENASPQELKFVKERVRKALEFLQALERRRTNILKVAEFIAEYHKDFLMGRKDYLDPITQSKAAALLNIPISTFNRVVKGRYADTPVGIFELRFFFTRGVPQGDKMVSKSVVKRLIKEMIENEDKNTPLSDQEIAKRLQEQGYEIKRRTVAEYRKEMGIPNSSKRRRKP